MPPFSRGCQTGKKRPIERGVGVFPRPGRREVLTAGGCSPCLVHCYFVVEAQRLQKKGKAASFSFVGVVVFGVRCCLVAFRHVFRKPSPKPNSTRFWLFVAPFALIFRPCEQPAKSRQVPVGHFRRSNCRRQPTPPRLHKRNNQEHSMYIENTHPHLIYQTASCTQAPFRKRSVGNKELRCSTRDR